MAVAAIGGDGVGLRSSGVLVRASGRGRKTARPRGVGETTAHEGKSVSTGLEVAAGHGLTHHNLPALVAHVPEIIEYNIGHSLVGRAVFVGLDRAVRDLVEIIRAR